MTLPQNIHIGICNGEPWNKPFGKTKGLKFEEEYEIELEAGVTRT